MSAHSQVSVPPQVDVLIVDDHEDSADSLELLLCTQGHAAACAYGGVAALEAILKLRPSVVVTDIAMPGFDGMTLAASVNRMALQPAPALIAYSALLANPRVAEASVECGIEDVFLKPDQLERLCERVGEILAARRG